MNAITKVAESQRRHSAQELAHWLRLFTQSGQKTREFCREQGLALSTFSYWRRRLREAAARPKAAGTLVKVCAGERGQVAAVDAAVSPIGIKEPGMIGVMEPVLGVENGHPCGVKNGRFLRCRQELICGRAERPWGCVRRVLRVPCNRRCGAVDRP